MYESYKKSLALSQVQNVLLKSNGIQVYNGLRLTNNNKEDE